MKYWTITTANLREEANIVSRKTLTIAPFQELLVTGLENDFFEVDYRGKRGYVYKPLLEELVETDEITDLDKNVVEIDEDVRNKTNSAKQYITVEGKTKYNLCGQFCVAYSNNDSIMSFLNKWKSKSPMYYALSTLADKPTGVPVLKDMQSVYHKNYFDFKNLLTDEIAGFLISPVRIKKLLQNHNLIVGLNINSAGQVIKGRAIGHWVCFVDIEPSGINNAKIKIYNPYLNRMEIIDYRLLLESMTAGIWNNAYTGLWIKKD